MVLLLLVVVVIDDTERVLHLITLPNAAHVPQPTEIAVGDAQ